MKRPLMILSALLLCLILIPTLASCAKSDIPDGYQLVACEHCDSHLHLKCVGCGKLFHMDEDISDELVSRIRACSAFSVDEEESVLYGKCSSCSVK